MVYTPKTSGEYLLLESALEIVELYALFELEMVPETAYPFDGDAMPDHLQSEQYPTALPQMRLSPLAALVTTGIDPY